jgi:polyribonucleotide nucleotidyltransferase
MAAGCAAFACAAPSTSNGRADDVDFCCRVGSLVWGTVRRVQDFGAFIGFDDTRASGLIHISNISRQHVGYTDVSAAYECYLILCTAVRK